MDVSPPKEDLGILKSKHGSDKVDHEGNYLPFYGYTCVCMVGDRLGAPQKCEEFIKESSVLRSYMSPLPASSYHATIYDIFTQRKVPERYSAKSGLVPSLHWTKAYNTLWRDIKLAQDQCEIFKDYITFSKTQLKVGRHPGGAVLIEGTLSMPEKVSALERNLKQIFENIGKPVKVYHITLGYVYKEVGEEAHKKIVEDLSILWDQMPKEILLAKPDICYFETMKEFIPAIDMQGLN